MRPSVRKELQTSYAVLGGIAVLGAIVLALFHDWGALQEERQQEAAAYHRRANGLPMQEQLATLQRNNAALAADIEQLKARVGMREVPPFVLPTETDKFGLRWTRVYGQVRDKLRDIAANRGVEYDEYLGFKFLAGRPPPNEEVRGYLLMLQLVSKAVYLALHAEGQELRSVTIDELQMRRAISAVEPEHRKEPLLREYHFTLRIEASLANCLWLLHRLGVDAPPTKQHLELSKWMALLTARALTEAEIAALSSERLVGNEISPLIVTGCTITSQNRKQDDGLEILQMELRLAGMEFIGQAPIAAAKPSPAVRRDPEPRGGQVKGVARP